MAAQFDDILSGKRVWGLEIGDERPVQNLTAFRVVEAPQQDAVWLGVKVPVPEERACECEGALTAETNHADAASSGRCREGHDSVCRLHRSKKSRV